MAATPTLVRGLAHFEQRIHPALVRNLSSNPLLKMRVDLTTFLHITNHKIHMNIFLYQALLTPIKHPLQFDRLPALRALQRPVILINHLHN